MGYDDSLLCERQMPEIYHISLYCQILASVIILSHFLNIL